jgi:hypothetical protein
MAAALLSYPGPDPRRQPTFELHDLIADVELVPETFYKLTLMSLERGSAGAMNERLRSWTRNEMSTGGTMSEMVKISGPDPRRQPTFELHDLIADVELVPETFYKLTLMSCAKDVLGKRLGRCDEREAAELDKERDVDGRHDVRDGLSSYPGPDPRRQPTFELHDLIADVELVPETFYKLTLMSCETLTKPGPG